VSYTINDIKTNLV